TLPLPPFPTRRSSDLFLRTIRFVKLITVHQQPLVTKHTNPIRTLVNTVIQHRPIMEADLFVGDDKHILLICGTVEDGYNINTGRVLGGVIHKGHTLTLFYLSVAGNEPIFQDYNLVRLQAPFVIGKVLPATKVPMFGFLPSQLKSPNPLVCCS